MDEKTVSSCGGGFFVGYRVLILCACCYVFLIVFCLPRHWLGVCDERGDQRAVWLTAEGAGTFQPLLNQVE
jgi:hypothetical protein